MSSDEVVRAPRDLVAIFHVSFHPTQGHVIDWALKSDESLNLDGVEFSVLPSGLHLVDQDVVYFTKDAHRGISIYRRRPTTDHGHRGFRLSSFGVLLAPSPRPRAWKHADVLKELSTLMYTLWDSKGVLDPGAGDWEPAEKLFKEREAQNVDLGGAGKWSGWSAELDAPNTELSADNPPLHLTHLLRILGPAALTLQKHVLGRRRILIYTLPPVEAACILCQVAADMCYEAQVDTTSEPKGRHAHAGGVHVLGMVTLNDLDKLRQESESGLGWIACTTDAIFLERPQHYDLIIDLTTFTPLKATRPTFSISKPVEQTSPSGTRIVYKLSTVRFTWSDIKLWNELDRLLRRDTSESGDCTCCAGSSAQPGKPAYEVSHWTDAWRVYEDVCFICAGLWMGSWRGNSAASYSGTPTNWGRAVQDGDNDWSLSGGYVRNVGMGIEGRPVDYGPGAGITSGSSLSKGGSKIGLKTWGKSRQVSSTSATTPLLDDDDNALSPPDEMELQDKRERQILTTLAILQTFHANNRFQLSRLSELLQSHTETLSASTLYFDTDNPSEGPPGGEAIVLGAKEVLSFELGPLSNLDARYLEWLGEEYGGGTKVVVKRRWRDLIGLALGLS